MGTKSLNYTQRMVLGVAATLVIGVAVGRTQQKGTAYPNAAALQQMEQISIQQQKMAQANAAAAANPRQTGNNSLGSSQGAVPYDTITPYFQESIRTKRNDERQKRLENDTQRLVSLAQQLKSEVAASGAESMTPDMMHKMDEIEKLARSVKDRMRN